MSGTLSIFLYLFLLFSTFGLAQWRRSIEGDVPDGRPHRGNQPGKVFHMVVASVRTQCLETLVQLKQILSILSLSALMRQ